MSKKQERNWRNLAGLWRRKPVGRKSPNKCQLGFEALEDRRLMAYNAAAGAFPEIPAAGSGFDGVVNVNNGCSGTLLWTGRHILTAAHCVDFDSDGAADAITHTVKFELPTGDVEIPVNAANVRIFSGWSSNPNLTTQQRLDRGGDVAIIELSELAPLAAERRGIYRQSNEVGQNITFLGYGRTNFQNTFVNQYFSDTEPAPSGYIFGGIRGANDLPGGNIKHRGFNNLDPISTLPNGQLLNFDTDDPGTPTISISFEAGAAPGDSGGPLLINNEIAGVLSTANPGVVSDLRGQSSYTRLSTAAVSSWIDSVVYDSFNLVINMNRVNTTFRNDGTPDTISFVSQSSIGGAILSFSINNTTFHADLADVRSITVIGSGDADTIHIEPHDAGLWNIPVTITGNGGVDALIVDDSLLGNDGPWNMSLNQTPGRIVRQKFTGDLTLTQAVNFSGMENVSYTGSSATNDYFIYGVPVGQTTTVWGSANADEITVYPRDATGAPSIRNDIAIFGGGGVDSIKIDDSLSTSSAVWSIYNPFDAPGNIQWQSFKVAGGGFISSNKDIEKTNLFGSQGVDNFNFSSYLNGSELRVDSGGGDDTFNMGVNTPEGTISGDLNYFKPLPFFEYKSGSGQDSFNIFNGNNPNGWQYARTNSSVYVQEDVVGGYYATYYTDAENVTIGGGAQADQFYIPESPTGSVTNLNGANGRDLYRLGEDTAGADNIRGVIFLQPSNGNDTVVIHDIAETSNVAVHVDGDQIGAHPDDHDLFGPGGRLDYPALTAEVQLRLGAGLDLVRVKPSSTKTLILIGNNPTAPSGDELQLNLAGMVNPVSGPDPILANATRYTFDNAAPVTYVGFETVVTAQNLSADFNADGIVGQEDYAIWQANLGKTSPPALGDANGDGRVDIADYTVWRDNLGAANQGAGSGAASVEAVAATTTVVDATASREMVAVMPSFELLRNRNKRPPAKSAAAQANANPPWSINRNAILLDCAFERFAGPLQRPAERTPSVSSFSVDEQSAEIALEALDAAFAVAFTE